MKKRFTKLFAALSLLVFMTPSLAGWGQTRDTKTDVMIVKGFAQSATSAWNNVSASTDYSAVANSTNSTGTTYAMTMFLGNTGQVRGNQSTASNNYSCRNTTTYDGYYISSVSLTVSGGTLDGSTNGRSVVYFGSSVYSNPKTAAPTGTSTTPSPASSAQSTLTWTNTDENVSYFILYNLKTSGTAVSANAQQPLTVVWTQKSGGGQQQTVATPTFELFSGETGQYLVDDDYVMLDCETDGATIYYTISHDLANPPADPTDASTEYDSNEGIELTETSIIKAIAYVGSDYSSVASKTYYFPSTIAEARAQTVNSTVYTIGTVTSIAGSSAYIQDANAAINVYGDNSLVVGNKYAVKGTLTNYSGLLEITSPTCTGVDGGTVIAPEVMTIANILTSANQGWFIKIEGATVGATSNNNTTLTQNGSSIVARNLSGASQGDVINLTGNIGHFGDYNQIANPIVIVGPSIIVDEDELSFTYQVGASTAPQETLVVEGSNLEGDITVAISGTGFKMSEGGSSWTTNNITLTPTNGTLDETMIGVQMMTGLSYGDYNGTITLTSTDAEPVTVTLTGHVTNQTYAINLTQPSAGGTIAADMEAAEAGATVTLTATPATGYAFGEWTVLKDDLVTEVEVDNNQFTMPNCEVLVSGSFSKNNYNINLAATTNGTIECDDETAQYGDEVMITVTPATGYQVQSFTVAETNGSGTVTNIEVADDIYSFSMPAFNITVTVVFEEIPEVYSGEGTFTKVTTLADLEDGGYYVLYGMNGNYNGAMNNTVSSGIMGSTSVNITNDVITDPSVAIVWKLEKNGNTWDLYNEDAEKYCYITGTSAKSFALSTDKSESNYTSYTVTVNDGNFNFVGGSSRMIAHYQNDFRTYADAKTLYLYKLGEAPTDPTITLANASVAANDDNCTMAITYQNMTVSGTSDFSILFCDAEGNNSSRPSWITAASITVDNSDYMVSCTLNTNTGSERTAYLKVVAEETTSNIASLTQAAPARTYTLATSIENGRHYIIANGSNKAMGGQNSNNRSAVNVDIANGTATVTNNDVFEFVINGPDANNVYTIYDANNSGYLYAAGSGDNKRLKTQGFNDANGQWTITIDSESRVATIIANGSNTNNRMRYNSQSTLFSCYASGQQDIYLYVKDNETNYDFYMDIAAWTVLQTTGDENKTDGWYFIALPVSGTYTLSDSYMVTGNYDLYRLNNITWENYKNNEHADFTTLNNGTGYLYANSANTTLHFSGDINEFTTEGNANVKNLSDGWNLIGNPYNIPIYINKPYYRMNAAGTAVETEDGITSIAIPAGSGVIVKATGDSESVTFTTSAPDGANNSGNIQMSVIKNNVRGNDVQDKAIVSFNEGSKLEKFQLFEGNAKLYIPQNGEDYAIAFSNRQGDMPLNFKTTEAGMYTISFEGDNMDLKGVYLIDMLAEEKIDLSVDPSYTFIGSPADKAERFKIVFRGFFDGASDDIFAFQSGSDIIVSGEGELQIFDVMGRRVKTQYVSGVQTVNVNAQGVYIMKLNEKTQKIIVR